MNILLPVDDSAMGLHEVRFALRLVHAGLRARFVLANVQAPATFYEVITAQEPVLIERAARSAGAKSLQQPKDLLAQADVPFVSEVLIGEPVEAMLDLIALHEIEMVIMGTRSLGWIREALTLEGSTSRRMLQYTPVPLLLVKAPETPAAD